ncbi:MAG TPA: carboxypeptidase-like regulatory domain-containing protein, partial [Pirellulales bacterium]|nr:carboxypeptidase-like regulatory domain-containing protein [Pirellulales bacterium]
TDRVGNVSDYKAVTVRIVAAEEAESPLNKVNGTVTYGKLPMAEMQVTLLPEKGEKLPPVVSDERGNFVIRDVAPGKYKITAEGVVRNKKRKAEAKVEVGPPPTRPKSIMLELR